jgi:hypothetical protein
MRAIFKGEIKMTHDEFLSLKKGDKIRHRKGHFVSFGTGAYTFEKFAGMNLDKYPLTSNVVVSRKGKTDVFCSDFVREYLFKV